MTETPGLLAHLAENADFDAVVTLVGEEALVEVRPESLVKTCAALLDMGFDRLGMVTAVDRAEVFELVYRLKSRATSESLVVKTTVGRDAATVPSVCGVWPAANWQEREVYDLFGVVFEGHPDLRRILLPEDWHGWPLRKDYDDPGVIRRPDYI